MAGKAVVYQLTNAQILIPADLSQIIVLNAMISELV